MRKTLPLLIVLVLAAALAAAGCGSDAGGSGGSGGKLALVAYSTPKEAYGEIIPAFQKTPEGDGVTFSQSYGSSGDQARSVISGLPADVVALSLAPDVDKLVEKNLVAKDWNAGPDKGFVTKSVVVFAVRPGNPKNIKTWDDLLKDDVEVVTPNPFTSGGARWNIMAAYGAQLEQGKSPAQAQEFLEQLLRNVVVQDKSARESLQTFQGGKGDVLLAYENEAITAQNKGEKLDYVIPDQTILIENPIAVIEKSENKAKAQAFVDYTRTEPAQKVFVENGYRPVLTTVNDPQKFPDPPGLFTIEKFGGWTKVTKEFFDPKDSVVAKIYQELGVSTGN